MRQIWPSGWKGSTFAEFDPPPEPLLAAGSEITHQLWPGQRLTVTADAVSAGHLLLLETNPGEYRPNDRTEAPAGAKTVTGPFEGRRVYRVLCDLGALKVEVR